MKKLREVLKRLCMWFNPKNIVEINLSWNADELELIADIEEQDRLTSE